MSFSILLRNGDISESKWYKFIKDSIPKKYEITNGFVIDSDGNVSEEIDIIIYDNLYSPYVLIGESDIAYVPAEAVYAIIEVKQSLNKKNLLYANKKIDSVKKLKRTSRGMIVAGEVKPAIKPKKIIGMILTRKTSIKLDTVKKNLYEYSNIDLLCALDDFTILSNRKNGLSFDIVDKNEALLGLFFFLNNMLYELGTVAAIDIREYANKLEKFNFDTKEVFNWNV